ncbi:MAG: type II toxin-antitoxin system VapC family toxin [Ignavibacteriae bacterium]|nr:type II toxin-antitoxin system VapC family toxin [Ignavibacteriota bacterium]
MQADPNHNQADQIWTEVTDGKTEAIMPMTVLVEVAGAVRRRTGSTEIAERAVGKLQQLPNVEFVPVDELMAANATRIASSIGMRGMDALVVEVAKRFNAELATFDKEMQRLAQKFLSNA